MCRDCLIIAIRSVLWLLKKTLFLWFLAHRMVMIFLEDYRIFYYTDFGYCKCVLTNQYYDVDVKSQVLNKWFTSSSSFWQKRAFSIYIHVHLFNLFLMRILLYMNYQANKSIVESNLTSKCHLKICFRMRTNSISIGPSYCSNSKFSMISEFPSIYLQPR